jgi:peptidoglycan/xylan/chitin deacetylase (PgdA/CDA1 family)
MNLINPIKSSFDSPFKSGLEDGSIFIGAAPKEDSQGILLNDFSDVTDFVNLGDGTATDDNVVFQTAGGSVKTSMTAGQNVNLRLNIPSTDLTGKCLLIRFRASSRIEISSATVSLQVGGTVKSQFVSITGIYANSDNEWWEACLSPADLSLPAADLTAIDNIRFRIGAINAVDVWWDECRIVDIQSQGEIMITFDDTYESQYTEAFAYMQPLGLVGTCYIQTSKIGLAGYMTEAQIRELFEAGWDIGSHCDEHLHLPALTDDEVREQLSLSKTKLQAIGINPTSFAYPFNDLDERTKNIVAEFYPMQAGGVARISAPSYQYTRFGYRWAEEDYASAAAANIDLDRLDLYGGMTELFFHDLVASAPGANETLLADFQAIIDHIVNNTSLVVTTPKERYFV